MSYLAFTFCSGLLSLAIPVALLCEFSQLGFFKPNIHFNCNNGRTIDRKVNIITYNECDREKGVAVNKAPRKYCNEILNGNYRFVCTVKN